MYPKQIHDYLQQFFNENDCEVIERHEHYLQVQLTIDMDKRIMNRPFYWRYVESVNETPKPAQLTLITDIVQLKNGVKGEVVHMGSPRLHQLFRVTKEMGMFVKMFEQINAKEHSQTVLTPWLCVNYKVAYHCHQTKEALYSLGINLMTGAIFQEFHETVTARNLAAEPPEQVYQLPYIITPQRAMPRLDALIERILDEQDHSWAEEAKKKWRRDQTVLDYFYEGEEKKTDSYEMEKLAIEERFKPKITVDIVNGGLFYLR